MSLIPKVAMLIGGIWALVSGRVPSMLVGGGKRGVEQVGAWVPGCFGERAD
jgi:hypothetical protein